MWVHCSEPETLAQSKQCKRAGSPPPQKFKLSPLTGKVMLVAFWDSQGMILTHFMPKRQTVTAIYYSESVFDIQRKLNDSEEHVLQSNVLVGDIVVVYGEIMGSHCYLRAQVLSFEGGHVEVFAIDYGYTLKVLDRHVFMLPEKLNTKFVKRKISLCSVDGVSPPPYDESLVHDAATILLNLCKQSVSAGELLVKMEGFQIIKNFVKECPKPRLTAQVLTILLNLTANYGMVPSIVRAGYIKILIDVISRYSERGVEIGEIDSPLFSNDEKLLLARCVMCLSNIICRNNDSRSQFYKQQGVDKINELMIKVETHDSLYYFCVKLLRIYLGNFKIKPDPAPTQPAPMQPVPMQPGANKNQLQNSENDSIEQRRTCPSNQSSADQLFTECFDTDSEHESQIVSGVENSRTPVSNNTDKSQGYFLGERLNVYDDEQHEMCPHRHVKGIHVLSFAKHVCGMLNTGHGGTIYFGVDDNSEVFGLVLTRDEKDRFRLGVDQHMFSKISPALLHSQFSIKDIPVLDPNTGQCIPDHYVIEISVLGSKGSIYTTIDGACYYRFGSDTSQITRQELRHLIVLEDETGYCTEIMKLLAEKQQLMRELHLTDS